MIEKKKFTENTPVLICIDSFYDGGAEMFAIRLTNNLPDTLKVYFLALRPWLTEKNTQKKLINTQKVKIIHITGTFWGDLFFKILTSLSKLTLLRKLSSYAMKWRLKYVCKKYSIKIVNSHSWETDNAFSEIKPQSNFKLVSSFHGHYELFEGSWLGYERACQRQLQLIDSVVYLSPKHWVTLDKYQVPDSKRTKIFYGLPVPRETITTTYHAQQPLQLIMTARGIPEKGWKEALEAVVDLCKEMGEKISIDLLGTGEELDRLRSKYEKYSYIHFIGHCDDVLPYVKKAHIGLLPSYYSAESLPNTIIEYLMCGKPVITSNVGAIPEMVSYDNKIAGAIIPAQANGISSAQIKDSIKEYILNPSKVEADSKLALQAAQKFEMETCITSYSKLFDSLLNDSFVAKIM